MNRRFFVPVFCCLALMVLATASAMAAGAKNPPLDKALVKIINPDEPKEFYFCASICSSSSPCDSCKLVGGVWTTCGQYAGRPANDLDGDGVVDTNDNCQCLANSNQANCDGDAYGDACDVQDNSWGRISVGTQRCYLDTDNHGLSTTLEFYYQDVYRSACTGQSCYKKYLKGTLSCSTGSDYHQYCVNHWIPSSDCGGAWNVDNCGLPRCAF